MSITPTPITINAMFGHLKYYIDFYQREYKWKKEHVMSLLDDIFYRFDNSYDATRDADETTVSQFDWYYLNTLITNIYDGKVYIVDGQQRLTTLTLMLITLHRLADRFNNNNLKEVIKSKILGVDISGDTFWMGQDGRTEILRSLLDEDISENQTASITATNLVQNFQEINAYLENRLDTQHKYTCFVIYFLKRIMLVKIDIGATDDVPMVFEVINDRGEKLRPYEVLKGQLLGRLKKDEIHRTYHPSWRESISVLESHGEEEADNFFKYLFRAKYADSEHHHRQFESDYHRTVLSKEWNEKIALSENVDHIKTFVNYDLKYFSKVYNKFIQPHVYDQNYGKFVYYNSLNEHDRQYMLMLSACELNDPLEEEKILLVSQLLDRHFALLQLFGCYDSRLFTEVIVEINEEIREKPLDEIKKIFDRRLLEDINNTKGLNSEQIFEYSFFRDAGIHLSIRFVRYFFTRIENFIATEINPDYRLSESQVQNLVRNYGHKTGYHVEHILANNDENLDMFGNGEEVFQRERNRLGALLLLKGRDNISSGNELYRDKLATYDNADISNKWNRSLIQSFYHTNKEFHEFCQKHNLAFKSYDRFDGTAVEERQRLLFEMVKIIWGDEDAPDTNASE